MSYILDALKKSEQQRLTTGVPNLNSAQVAPLDLRSRSRAWPLIAFGVLILAAGGLGWWLAGRPAGTAGSDLSSAPGVPVPSSVASAPPQPRGDTSGNPNGNRATAPVQATPAAQDGAATQLPDEHPAPPQVSAATVPQPVPRLRQDATFAGRPLLPERAEPAPVRTQTETRAPMAARAAPAASAPQRAIAPPETAPPTPRSAQPAAQERPAASSVIAYGELPSDVRNSLPPLEIGGYAEGPAGAPMIVIDDRLVREGEEVGPGIKVEKISPDGAVFRYRNYRFRR